MRIKHTHILLFFMLLLTISQITVAESIRPNYVYDFADILTDTEEDTIEEFCISVDHNTTAEIVVVIITNLNDFNGDIDLARNKYFNNIPLDGVTGIGKAGKNNGVLLIIAMEEMISGDSKWGGIETGYGVEGDLTDSEVGRIGRDIMIPQFQEEGRHFDGIFNTVQHIALEIGYDDVTINVAKNGEITDEEIIIYGIIAMFVLIFICYILSRVGAIGGGGGWSSGSSGSGGGSSRT
jgi:uncharacterized protein